MWRETARREGHRWGASLGYSLLLVSLGMIVGSLGPSLSTLERQTGSSEKDMGWLFAARGMGYASSGIIGGLLLDKFYARGHLILGILCLVLGLMTAVVPAISSLPLLLAVYFLIGICLGFDDVSANTFITWIWQKDVGPWMQLIHLGFGVGAVLSGLLFGVFASILGDVSNSLFS